ncbi:adenylosuccinate synthetase [Streptomyces sp. RKAG293]|uniref:adenylosuccinate synthetase n=1 Tax=Streptomyces sp. RKAG293 TaxID=2893403 RepID=UPI0020336EE2|nr:adenylosuccinate synthetase [Streptomyces sp. RKAG293]
MRLPPPPAAQTRPAARPVVRRAGAAAGAARRALRGRLRGLRPRGHPRRRRASRAAAGRRAGRLRGAQGVLLDEWHGFHPYTTWSTTTFANAETLLAEAGGAGTALRLGVVRTYTTRHGPGPLVTEDPELARELPEPHNGHGRWQGAFRTGHFDAVAHAYAVEVCGGVDALAVTHLDAPARCPGLRIARAYGMDGRLVEHLPAGAPGDLGRQAALTARLEAARPAVWDTPGADPDAWSAAVGAALSAPVALESYGPTYADVRDRRETGKSKYVSGNRSGVYV